MLQHLRQGQGVLLGLVVVVLLAQAAPARAELIVNGGFENPVLTPGTQFVTLSGAGLPGWTTFGPGGGNIDLIRDYWPAFIGIQSIDLVGFSGVGTGITQSFGTTPGETYLLTFAYANNVDASFATGLVEVLGAGPTPLVSSALLHTGSTRANMNYTPFTAFFTANSSTTTLRFTHTGSNIPQFSGLALDAVSVTSVPEPASVVMLGAGLLGLGLVRRRRKE